jgi:TPR repeat protein
VGLAVKGVKTASTEATIAVNKNAAETGDAKAQFELGSAKCCAIGSVDLIHDNVQATAWLCRSARQGYAPAAYRLGRIYAGKPILGIDPQQNAKLLLIDFPRNNAVAALWLMRAAQGGGQDAMSALADLTPRLTLPEQAQAQSWMADWTRAPCEWADVIQTRSGSR